jgi:hypothetical protein
MGRHFRAAGAANVQVRCGAACRNRTDDLFITSEEFFALFTASPWRLDTLPQYHGTSNEALQAF